MKSTIFLCLFTSILFTQGCKSTKTSKNNFVKEVAVESIITSTNFRKVEIDKEIFNATTNLPAFDTAYIVADTLHIITGKLQACDAKHFSAFTNGSMMKSLPPQGLVKLFLMTDPTCKTSSLFHLKFNLVNMRFKQDTKENGNRTTIVRLLGWETPLTYRF